MHIEQADLFILILSSFLFYASSFVHEEEIRTSLISAKPFFFHMDLFSRSSLFSWSDYSLHFKLMIKEVVSKTWTD